MASLTAITSAPLDTEALVRALDTTGIGAVTTFIGLVRDNNLGRRVLHLEYEAYEALALRGLELIVAEAVSQWPTVRLGIHHRTGRMEIGEASVAIAAASPRFEASIKASDWDSIAARAASLLPADDAATMPAASTTKTPIEKCRGVFMRVPSRAAGGAANGLRRSRRSARRRRQRTRRPLHGRLDRQRTGSSRCSSSLRQVELAASLVPFRSSTAGS